MRVEVWNRQRTVPVPQKRLERFAAEAAARTLNGPSPAMSDLANLDAVEVSLVSDRAIASLHRRFLQVRGATDVITFPHGEIVISATTAGRAASENGESVEREVARYIVHGLLHLHGYDDVKSESAQAMWKAQEATLDALWPRDQRPGIASKR